MGQEGRGKREKHAHFLKSRDGNGTLLPEPSPDERPEVPGGVALAFFPESLG